jgi:hypothetical protein
MPATATPLVEHADALYRAASECQRQHSRYARLVELGASDDEQKSALEMAYLCDDALGTAVLAYELGSKPGKGADEPWWHRANMLWHASREYIRRHSRCEGMARRLGRQSPNRLAELTLAFDLEASALLGLRMAADSYREVRPTAG